MVVHTSSGSGRVFDREISYNVATLNTEGVGVEVRNATLELVVRMGAKQKWIRILSRGIWYLAMLKLCVLLSRII